MSDTPHLSDQYYKARKNLSLFSGLLFAWEFIGLEIAPKPAQDLNVTLKSPQATPYVLLALTAYFLARLLTEWNQSSPERRSTRASRFDLALSLAIPVTAILTFALQRALEIRIVNLVSMSWFFLAICGTLIGSGATYLLLSTDKTPGILLWPIMIICVVTVGVIGYRESVTITVLVTLVGIAVGSVPIALAVRTERS